MKKNFMKVATVALLLLGSSNVNAQVTLGNVLSAVSGVATNSSTTKSSSSATGIGSLVSGLTSVFNSSKVASAEDLVGTWTYTQPAVVLSDANVLQNIGGKVVSAAIESKLKTYLSKYGITKGNMTMTFDKDGNFTQVIGQNTLSGTYTISGQNVVLTYTGGVKQLIGTTQLNGDKLQIVMDASKLLKYGKTIGSLVGTTTSNTIGSLISSYDGLQMGLTLEKTVVTTTATKTTAKTTTKSKTKSKTVKSKAKSKKKK